MKKNYSRWKEKEIKQLFNFIQQQSENNITRAKAFALYGQQAKRKPNSVRNYYYLELEYLQNHPQEAKNLA